MQAQVIEGYRLSPQQRRLLRAQDGSSAFRSWCAINVDGHLHDGDLKRAVTRLVNRHDMLRASFHKRAGMRMPIQVVDQREDVRWEEIDLRGMRECEQEARLRNIYDSERGGGPGRDSGSGVRARLARLSETNRVLIISLPSLCADGWAIRALARELAATASARVRPAAQVGANVPYVHFAEWQNEILESTDEEARQGRAHWEKVASRNGKLALPRERRGAGAAGFAPEIVETEIDASSAKRIKEVAAEFDATVREVLAACWAGLIRRLSGQEEVVLWEVMDGRKYEELQDGVGLYAKSIPLRLRVEENMRFSALLLNLIGIAREGYELQEHYNSDDKAAGLKAPCEYPLSFEYCDGKWSHTDAGTTFTLLRQYSCIDRFKVKLSCFDLGESIRAELHYDPEVYDRQAAERLAGWLNSFIRSAVSNPVLAINRLEILSEVERHHVAVELNDTDHVYPAGKCIHELFEQQAALTPDAAAAAFEEKLLSYGELNRRANRLANRLRSIGITRDCLVGLCLDRSLDLLVGMMGIQKAGGAYVPLDPAYPSKRMAMILEDAGVSAVVTSRQMEGIFREQNRAVIRLDADLEEIAGQDENNPASGVTPENLVYAIFTSGSTGRPKGVAVEHRHLFNYAHGAIKRLGLSAGSSFATVSTFSADLGNTAIYPSLIAGGCLHIISPERATNPAALADYFSRHRIDCLKIVPSHLAALLASSRPDLLMPRERLVLGGEASRANWIEQLRGLAPDCAIFNHYGPTETTVGVLTYSISDSPIPQSCPTVPLGRPIPNTRSYILDHELQPIPPGVAGELYIGGANVARGYLSRPEFTADRFIPDPFNPRPGSRLYKTGDLARHLPEGDLEFMGRCDDQVKFHGYRVELNEIRAALNRHLLIKDSVVAVARDANGNDLIVAYYVSRQEIDVAELRELLKENIIAETLPNIYVHLKRLPLTTNGKIDYQALPGVEEAKKQIKRSQVLPTTPTQEVIAGIWADVLGLEQIGIEDDFFELGGHSLLATQVVSRVRDLLDVEVALRVLFESPTVAGLAEAVEREQRLGRRAEAPPIVAVSRDQELPLSFAQQRLWFIHQLEPDSPAYNVPIAVRMRGPLDTSLLRRSLHDIAARHEALRTRFEVRDGRPVQVIDEPGEIKLSVQDISGLDERDRERRAREIVESEASKPFDLERGPVWRAALVRMNTDDHVMLLNMHHVASDAWSAGVFVNELTSLYESYREGRSAALPPLPAQYADFAVWQRGWLQGEVLEQHLDYWRHQLTGASALELPTDRPQSGATSHPGATVAFRLSAELTRRLKETSRREGVTPFMTLLAAFKVLLSRYAGQHDITVGTPIANRNRIETEGLIGFFINQLVLRTDLSGNPTFRELLRRVREVTLGAYAHQDVPFEKLVAELTPERDLNRSLLFDAMLVLRNTPPLTARLTDLSLTPFGEIQGPAKFNLTWALVDSADGVTGVLEYAADLFNASTAIRLARHLHLLLEQILHDTDRRLGQFTLLTPGERQQTLVEWNDTQRASADSPPLQESFESQAIRTPDRICLAFRDEQLSYSALNERANRLADHLRELGVRPEVSVGVCLERSLEMVIALLGALKSGGAYVPLDPNYPVERLAYMLDDSNVFALLTSSKHLEDLPQTSARLVCLDRDLDATSERAAVNAGAGAAPENLAYIIYTSGSTGRPKGVGVSHGELATHIAEAVVRYEILPKDVVLQFASNAFDVSLEQILPALVSGAKVVLSQPSLAPVEFHEELLSSSITVMDLPPAYWREWARELEADDSMGKAEALRLMIMGGEAMPAGAREICSRAGIGARLVNAYGPTEATITALTQEVAYEGREMGEKVPPIGRPLSNRSARIIDVYGNEMAIGGRGELCLGGRGLARGYLNRPDLTAEMFVPDPFADEGSARMYRTGDRARYLGSGEVEFLGRLDQQVKIRGFRIELGEIESRLKDHPGVRDAVVMARDDGAAPVADANTDYGEASEDDLVNALMSLDSISAEELLAEAESLSEGIDPSPIAEIPSEQISRQTTLARKTQDFEISLQINNDQFIKPPQDSQRNWILRRALDEFADDLKHMNEVSKRFVTSSERAQISDEWAVSKANRDASNLIIEGQQVMQDWERPLMEAMADIATESHGDVLELGFGMGISATFIQERGTRSHTIVECNQGVVAAFEDWKSHYPGRDIRLVCGKWQEAADRLGSFDAIFFDTYPVSEDEFREYVINSITFAEHFFPTASDHLKPGGIFTYYTNEIDSFSRRHQRLVLKHFSSFALSVVRPLYPPKDCNYWWADSMVVIKAVK